MVSGTRSALARIQVLTPAPPSALTPSWLCGPELEGLKLGYHAPLHSHPWLVHRGPVLGSCTCTLSSSVTPSDSQIHLVGGWEGLGSNN